MNESAANASNLSRNKLPPYDVLNHLHDHLAGDDLDDALVAVEHDAHVVDGTVLLLVRVHERLYDDVFYRLAGNSLVSRNLVYRLEEI